MDLCLSGTAEMGLGAKLTDSTVSKENLPQKLAAISRCFRAETSKVVDERGIYRCKIKQTLKKICVLKKSFMLESTNLQKWKCSP